MTDKHINAVNNLLSHRFPSQNGLMCPLILDEYKKYESSSDKFVQITNISLKHWVCVSNIFSPSGTVNVYDSMPHFNQQLFAQIAAILKTPDKEFQVRHIDVQRQKWYQ